MIEETREFEGREEPGRGAEPCQVRQERGGDTSAGRGLGRRGAACGLTIRLPYHSLLLQAVSVIGRQGSKGRFR